MSISCHCQASGIVRQWGVGARPATICSGIDRLTRWHGLCITYDRTTRDAGGARPAVTKQGASVGTMLGYLTSETPAIASAN